MNAPITREPEWEMPPEVFLRLLEGVAPERSAEFAQIFQEYQPRFFVSQQARNDVFHSQGNAVRLAPNARDALWFWSFAAWHAFRAHIPAEVLVYERFEDDGLYEALQATRDVNELARSLLRDDTWKEIEWPAYIPRPEVVIAGQDSGDPNLRMEDVAIKDLALFAFSYVVLHELRHVMFRRDSNAPSRFEEELECDRFAVSMVIGKASTWSPQDGTVVPEERVIFKRALGLFFGFFVLHSLTRDFDRGGSENYPALDSRLRVIVDSIALAEDHNVWLVGITMLRELYRDSIVELPAPDQGLSLKEQFIRLASPTR